MWTIWNLGSGDFQAGGDLIGLSLNATLGRRDQLEGAGVLEQWIAEGDALDAEVSPQPLPLQFGEFLNFGTSYLGFEFQAEIGSHYGYAEITDQGANGFVIESVACESEPGQFILTGARPTIPEPSTSMFLGICAFVLLGQRRRNV